MLISLLNSLIIETLFVAACIVIIVGYCSFDAYQRLFEQEERKIKRLDRIIKLLEDTRDE